MEDPNSPEAVAARANQADPIKMYLIVRTSLEMSMGKTAAQVGHAVQMLQIKYSEFKDELSNMEDLESTFGSLSPSEAVSWAEIHPQYYLYQEWLNTSFCKVVLACKDKDWEKVKAAVPNHVLVVDAGLTEIAPGSETVIGLWPMRESEAPKAVHRLQVLK